VQQWRYGEGEGEEEVEERRKMEREEEEEEISPPSIVFCICHCAHRRLVLYLSSLDALLKGLCLVLVISDNT
jgi:hypothetical protein